MYRREGPMAAAPKLTKRAFLQWADRLGLDTSDAAHMDEVYGHLQEVMAVIANLRKIELGDTEPANIFSPAKE
jgi:hypothetical protein